VNDTGLLGLLVFAAFVGAITVATWRARHDITVLGLAMMMLVLGITSTATEPLELMIPWLLTGLLLAAVHTAVSGASAIPRTAASTGS
jgi:hypothetical protein